MNKLCFFDCEADGLLDSVSKIHVICINNKVFHDDETLEREGTLKDAIAEFYKYDVYIGHNIIGYDIPLIDKLLSKELSEHIEKNLIDTYLFSQFVFNQAEQKKHSLDYWGKKLGHLKPEHEDWTQLSEEMIFRCAEDVQITEQVYQKIRTILPPLDVFRAPWVRMENALYKYYNQQQFGINFDIKKAEKLISRLTQLKAKYDVWFQKQAPKVIRKEKSGDTSHYAKVSKKDGKLSKHIIGWCETTGVDSSMITGPFSPISIEPINMNSPAQAVKWLLSIGWRPDDYNYKTDERNKLIKDDDGNAIITSPKMRDSDFYGISEILSKRLQKRGKVKHRLGVLESWVKKYGAARGPDGDGLLPTPAYTAGTSTTRFKHMIVANIPQANESKFLGRAMRSLFIPRDGYIFVGCDASQLEARIEAHYTTPLDGGELARLLLEGDVHQVTADNLNVSRQEAKNINYALKYGAAPGKLVSMLGVDLETATKLHKDYWDSMPAAKHLKDELRDSLIKKGYKKNSDIYYKHVSIPSLDERPIYVRSWHSLYNALIQSAGSICMKWAYCYLCRELERSKLDARIAVYYHDEFVIECLAGDSEQIKSICQESIKKAGEYFKLNVELLSDAKNGMSWGEIHS